jgi:tripartite-type tricarboxylate transporter receptor subunit TctC
MRFSPFSLVMAGGRLAARPCAGETETGALRTPGHAVKTQRPAADADRLRTLGGGTMRRLLAACAFAVCASVGSTALGPVAQAQDFPSKLIRIVVPFTPGGSNDVVGRELAAGFQSRWSHGAVVENRPGGGGTIAYSQVAKAPPDGYLLLIAPVSFTITPHMSRNPPFNPLTDYAPINMVADVPFAMVIHPSVPARNLKEFIALAKASPGKMSYASVGVGTPQHLGGELFKLSAGVDLVHVPFRGATAVLPDLVAGRVQMFIGAINSLLPLIKDGKLIALGATSLKRIPSLPDVPTVAETFPGFEVGSGVGLVAPAGTPAPIVDILNRASAEVIATKGFHDRMAAIGVEVVGTTPAQHTKIIADDYAKWAKVVKEAGLQPQ